MSALDEILAASAASPAAQPMDAPPRRRLAIVACMDARLDLLDGFGLALGDAHILRNAGGIPTDDVLRSLAISQHELGTREIAVIHHTKCGMDGFDDDEFRYRLINTTSAFPPWRVPGFTDLTTAVRSSVETVRRCPWLPHRDQVRGFILDVETGALTEVR
jgi:carbonic anhydrase